jgi:hypothetical protein
MLHTVVERKYKYIYQGDRATRYTHQFEYHEQDEIGREDIKQFADKIDEKQDGWLKQYITQYYRTPADDGQTNVDYMIQRCERLYTWEEMQRSWRAR